jgi:hypothetical protein
VTNLFKHPDASYYEQDRHQCVLSSAILNMIAAGGTAQAGRERSESMTPVIPPEISPVLDDYLGELERRLPGLLAGFYLHGSLALAAFNPRLSDIDFLAITSRPTTDSDCATLQAIHADLARRHPRWPLEGSYLQWGDVGRCDVTLDPRPHYHDGVLTPASRQDTRSVTWWVTWWLVRHSGIAMAGPPGEELPISLDWDDMHGRMRENLAGYWSQFVNRPARMAWLLADYGIQWAVLGVLRQHYSLRESAITSKEGAASYGLATLPTRWHRLIGEGLAIRAGAGGSAYRWRPGRAIEARAFLAEILADCAADRS